MAQHARLKIDAGVQVYLCDPQSPWQRGTNENTNGLPQYFLKGTSAVVRTVGAAAWVVNHFVFCTAWVQSRPQHASVQVRSTAAARQTR